LLRHIGSLDLIQELLRRFDDLAKDPAKAAPPLRRYEPIMRACAMQPA